MSKITQQKKAARAAAAASGTQAPSKEAIVGMKASDIDALARQIKPGNHVTFRYDSTADPLDTRFLIFGEKDNILVFGRMDSITFQAIFESQDWDRSQNKIVKFTAGPKFTYDWFRSRVQLRIDYINVVH